MGEIADLMLDGIICECCGIYLEESTGYPSRCGGCSKDQDLEQFSYGEISSEERKL